MYRDAFCETAIGHTVGEAVPDSARQLFRTVPDSMFTLFVLMNGEDAAAVVGDGVLHRCTNNDKGTKLELPVFLASTYLVDLP